MTEKIDKENLITAIYLVVSEICEKALQLPKPRQKQKLTDSEVVTIAICSALFFENNHDKALFWLYHANFFTHILTSSRYNRRIHRLQDIIEFCLQKIFEILANNQTYIIDSMPLPTCKRARASKNKKLRGKQYCGYCAAQKQKFFGFRLHMVTATNGTPINIQILPGAFHDLTPIHEMTSCLPQNSIVIGDKAYNCQNVENILKQFGITLMPIRKKNSKQQWLLAQESFIKDKRHQIETSFSILSDMMGLNRIKARTLNGFFIKVYAAILALIFHINFN